MLFLSLLLEQGSCMWDLAGLRTAFATTCLLLLWFFRLAAPSRFRWLLGPMHVAQVCQWGCVGWLYVRFLLSFVWWPVGAWLPLSSPGGFLLESKDLPGYCSLLRVFSRWGVLIELRGLDLLLACSFVKSAFLPSWRRVHSSSLAAVRAAGASNRADIGS
jgi:hypothetical protein